MNYVNKTPSITMVSILIECGCHRDQYAGLNKSNSPSALASVCTMTYC